MPPAPLFSIILPCFNAAEKLGCTLDSILEQQADYELLVLDGASQDDTLNVLQGYATRFGPRLRYWSEPDIGVYDAMNKGISLTKGRYFYFLGAGDALRTGALQNVAAHLPDSDCALLYGRVFWEQMNEIYGTPFIAFDLARRNIPHQATFYGRQIFEQFGSYDTRYPILADYAFNIRIWRQIPKHYVDLIVANYEGNGLSVQQRDKAFIRDQGRLVWRYLGPFSWLVFKLDALLAQEAKDRLRALRHRRIHKPKSGPAP